MIVPTVNLFSFISLMRGAYLMSYANSRTRGVKYVSVLAFFVQHYYDVPVVFIVSAIPFPSFFLQFLGPVRDDQISALVGPYFIGGDIEEKTMRQESHVSIGIQ